MNVTDRGYFTTSYLDNYNKQRSRHVSNPRRGGNPDASGGSRKISDSSLTNQTHKTGAASSMVPSLMMINSPELNKSVTTGDYPKTPETPYTGYTKSSNNDAVDVRNLAINPDDLHEEITPAQLNILQKQYQKPRRPHHRNRRHHYEDYDDEDDYDYGVNYGDENSSFDAASGDNRSSMYDNYYNREHNLRVPKKSRRQLEYERLKKQEARKKAENNYYIQQKKRYDDAEYYKPTNYTHKTFRDVFDDNDEESGKYNPMEFVFDDPQKIKEQEQNQKLKTAFKNIQLKLGRDDYNNYDYYDNKDKTSNVANEIFVQGGAESDDDSDYNGGGQIQEIVDYSNDGESVADSGASAHNKTHEPKRKVNFKKLWKTKTKQLKKDLGKDFFNNMEKQWVIEEEKKRRKELENIEKQQQQLEQEHMQQFEEEHTSEPIITEPDDEQSQQFYAGPRPDFHPLWNYLLSWLAYEQPKSSSGIGRNDYNHSPTINELEIKSIELPEAASTLPLPGAKSLVKSPTTVKPNKKNKKKNNMRRIKMTREQLKNFNKNVNKVKNMWNLPASNLFANNYAANINNLPSDGNPQDPHDFATINQSLPQSSVMDISPFDGNSQEFVIEVDDEDGAEYDEELYYNPNTGQLEREPPTSYSSMEKRLSNPSSPRTTTTANKSLIDTSHGAKTIISNINQLIKSVKIMRIIFAPIDIIAESFPNLQTLVILVELGIFMWLLYELSLLIDALCMMVKAVCAPMIAVGRFMNRIV